MKVFFSDIIEIEKSNKKKKKPVFPQKYRVHSLTSATKEVVSFPKHFKNSKKKKERKKAL